MLAAANESIVASTFMSLSFDLMLPTSHYLTYVYLFELFTFKAISQKTKNKNRNTNDEVGRCNGGGSKEETLRKKSMLESINHGHSLDK